MAGSSHIGFSMLLSYIADRLPVMHSFSLRKYLIRSFISTVFYNHGIFDHVIFLFFSTCSVLVYICFLMCSVKKGGSKKPRTSLGFWL